jgi:predicted phosphodiesterase
MRLHVLSDLHLERAPFDQPAADADAVILAGDVAPGIAGVSWAREWAGDRPVLMVAGNHEFYGHAMPELVEEMRAAAAGSAVHILENDAVVIGGTRFLGCTLWSDFAFDGVERLERSMALCRRVVNDYKQIRWEPEDRPLLPADTLALHLASRQWLAEQLALPHAGPTVVITHHVPLVTRTPPEGPLRALAGAFASDLTPLIGGDSAALWIYGHTHVAADLDHAGTRILSNPRGYPGQRVDGFDPGRVITV